MEGLAYHWPLDGDTRAAVGGSDAVTPHPHPHPSLTLTLTLTPNPDQVAGRVAWVPDGWVSERRAPSEGGARFAAHFAGDALGAEAAYRGDAGEICARYGRDMGEIWAR